MCVDPTIQLTSERLTSHYWSNPNSGRLWKYYMYTFEFDAGDGRRGNVYENRMLMSFFENISHKSMQGSSWEHQYKATL